MKIQCDNPEAVAKEALWLAWQACGGPYGMGVFQDQPGATKEQVVANAMIRGDYPAASINRNKPGELYADYVFGRMVKLIIRWDVNGIEVNDNPPRRDYQSWCHEYQTYEILILAAIESIKKA